MSLYVQTQGRGEHIVLLHGWGTHADIWSPLADILAKEHCVSCIDLPGYARSKQHPLSDSLDKLTDELRDIVPSPACWVGWSMGGLIALDHAIRYPASVNKLVLIASTPRFTRDQNWPHAIDPDVLNGFARELETDYQATINRFLALQVQGCPDARQQIRHLQERVFLHGEPAIASLKQGLALLQNTDLRDQLAVITTPTLLIAGERDRLVSAGAIEATCERMPCATTCIIKQAGHAPFLSHPELTADYISGFLYE